MTTSTTQAVPLRQDMGRPRRRGRRPLEPALHRPPPRPRGDLPPGLRGAPPRQPRRPPAGLHADHGRPQRPHDRPLGADGRLVLHRGGRQPDPGPADADERRRLRPAVLRDGGRAAGNRAHHRARAGVHAAGVHDRLRGQSHGDPRGVRGAGFRDRHERGGARSGHSGEFWETRRGTKRRTGIYIRRADPCS